MLAVSLASPVSLASALVSAMLRLAAASVCVRDGEVWRVTWVSLGTSRASNLRTCFQTHAPTHAHIRRAWPHLGMAGRSMMQWVLRQYRMRQCHMMIDVRRQTTAGADVQQPRHTRDLRSCLVVEPVTASSGKHTCALHPLGLSWSVRTDKMGVLPRASAANATLLRAHSSKSPGVPRFLSGLRQHARTQQLAVLHARTFRACSVRARPYVR